MTHDPSSPSAEERLYLALNSIPHGQVIAYGELAALAGLPGRARWVGRTLSQLPEDTQLPWHRVTNAQRRISLAVNSPAFQRQRERLISEGWHVSPEGKITALTQ